MMACELDFALSTVASLKAERLRAYTSGAVLGTMIATPLVALLRQSLYFGWVGCTGLGEKTIMFPDGAPTGCDPDSTEYQITFQGTKACNRLEPNCHRHDGCGRSAHGSRKRVAHARYHAHALVRVCVRFAALLRRPHILRVLFTSHLSYTSHSQSHPLTLRPLTLCPL